MATQNTLNKMSIAKLIAKAQAMGLVISDGTGKKEIIANILAAQTTEETNEVEAVVVSEDAQPEVKKATDEIEAALEDSAKVYNFTSMKNTRALIRRAVGSVMVMPEGAMVKMVFVNAEFSYEFTIVHVGDAVKFFAYEQEMEQIPLYHALRSTVTNTDGGTDDNDTHTGE